MEQQEVRGWTGTGICCRPVATCCMRSTWKFNFRQNVTCCQARTSNSFSLNQNRLHTACYVAAQCCPDLESPTFKHAQSQILLDCRPEDPPQHSESPKSQSRSPKHKPNISQASVKLSHSRHLATPNLKCAYLLCRAPVQSRVQRFQTHQLLLDLLHLATASHLPWIFFS